MFPLTSKNERQVPVNAGHQYWCLGACGDGRLAFQVNGRYKKSEGGLLPGGYGFI